MNPPLLGCRWRGKCVILFQFYISVQVLRNKLHECVVACVFGETKLYTIVQYKWYPNRDRCAPWHRRWLRNQSAIHVDKCITDRVSQSSRKLLILKRK